MSLFDIFKGGGASGSIGSSANQTSNTTDNKNNATSGSGSAIFDTRGGNIKLSSSTTDQGTVAASFDLARKAITDTLAGYQDAFSRAAAISTDAQTAKDKATRDSLKAVVDLSTNQSKAGVQGLTENVFKWSIIAAGVVSVAYFGSKAIKGRG